MTSVPTKYRALFLSDFHLGSPNCKAKRLYKFLLKNTADTVYLVGDIVEGYHFGRWPPYHDLVLGLLAESVRSGIEIIFIPGNHDPEFRNHLGIYGSLRIARRTVHDCLDGRRMLVTHGDETDRIPLGRLLTPVLALERVLGFSLWNVVRRYFPGWLNRHVERFEDEMRSIGLLKHDGVI
jgi:predicted phosphodiesterase